MTASPPARTAAGPGSSRTAPGDRPRPARYSELEAFRALAALAVVVFHAYQFARVDGVYIYTGRPPDLLLRQLDGAVAVFLALSGFLLFQPVAAAVRDGRAVAGAGRFLARRAVRVVPLYLVATLVVWGFRTPALRVGWADLAAHLTFTHVFFADTSSP